MSSDFHPSFRCNELSIQRLQILIGENFLFERNSREDKGLTSSASADEPQIVKLGDLILHQSRRISKLGTTILIIASAYSHQGTVAYFAESYNFESHRKSFIRPPVCGQNGTNQMRRAYNQNVHMILLATRWLILLMLNVHYSIYKSQRFYTHTYKISIILANLYLRKYYRHSITCSN